MKYPCNYCGSCPIWLAAYEPGNGLDVDELVINACRKRNCPLLGKEVIPEDAPYAYWLHRGRYNDYIWCECSYCGFWVEAYKAVETRRSSTDYVDVKYKFCPICGKEMRV